MSIENIKKSLKFNNLSNNVTSQEHRNGNGVVLMSGGPAQTWVENCGRFCSCICISWISLSGFFKDVSGNQANWANLAEATSGPLFVTKLVSDAFLVAVLTQPETVLSRVQEWPVVIGQENSFTYYETRLLHRNKQVAICIDDNYSLMDKLLIYDDNELISAILLAY